MTKTGQVIDKAEKHACRAFPDPHGDGLESGTKRNFQILSALDFLAEFTQHIPPHGAHLIRYYGWYSNKARGMRQKRQQAAAEAAARPSNPEDAARPSPARCSRTWAMLIKRVYEVDTLACPQCGGRMKVIAFIEPPQGEVIEKILRHCGLWRCSAPQAPPSGDGSVRDVEAGSSDSQMASYDEAGKLTYVDIDTFPATF